MPHTTAPVHYRVQLHDLHAHLYRITLTIAQPSAQQRVSLPVWIPGSYLVREFAKNLHGLHARRKITCCPTAQQASMASSLPNRASLGAHLRSQRLRHLCAHRLAGPATGLFQRHQPAAARARTRSTGPSPSNSALRTSAALATGNGVDRHRCR